MKKVYLVEVGVLVGEDNPEYGFYSQIYDKKHGFYDEEQFYARTLADAIAYAKQYVAVGVDNTYAVVSEAFLDDEVVDASNEPYIEADVEDESYALEDVVFSTAKINDEVVEAFLAA